MQLAFVSEATRKMSRRKDEQKHPISGHVIEGPNSCVFNDIEPFELTKFLMKALHKTLHQIHTNINFCPFFLKWWLKLVSLYDLNVKIAVS